jgi:hypothetical protein
MKHNAQGTIYSLLTVESDGQMTMTFHGTDREICHEVTENADGWLCYPGGMFPGLKSGKWNKMADVRGLRADVVETNTNDTNNTNEVAESETTTDDTDCTDNHAEPEVVETTTDDTDCTFERPRQSGKRLTPRGKKITTTDDTNYTNNESVTMNPEPLTINHPRPRRQRKPRKPRVERQPSTISHQPSDIDRHQPSSTLKAIGMVAAATVALFVIYETGLLIPLGLIGLATGGILK